MEKTRLLRRPGNRRRILKDVLSIITPLTGSWFTGDVAEHIALYEKQGFVFVKRYDELREHGAVEYEKRIDL